MRGLRVPGGAAFSRKKLDELGALAQEHGAGGLVWIKKVGGRGHLAREEGASRGNPRGACSPRREVGDGDLLLLVADAREGGLRGARRAARPRRRARPTSSTSRATRSAG